MYMQIPVTAQSVESWGCSFGTDPFSQEPCKSPLNKLFKTGRPGSASQYIEPMVVRVIGNAQREKW